MTRLDLQIKYLDKGLSRLGLSRLGLSRLGLSRLGLSRLGLSRLGLSRNICSKVKFVSSRLVS